MKNYDSISNGKERGKGEIEGQNYCRKEKSGKGKNSSKEDSLTQEELKQKLNYDSDTGIFTWIKRNGRRSGCPTKLGYLQIVINKRHYYAHRLAWLYIHGVWPRVIDHINHNPSDNRISNLRSGTQSQNLENKIHPQSNNSTGILGIHFHHHSGLWVSRLQKHGKVIHYSYHKTKELAQIAYLKAKRELHEFCTI